MVDARDSLESKDLKQIVVDFSLSGELWRAPAVADVAHLASAWGTGTLRGYEGGGLAAACLPACTPAGLLVTVRFEDGGWPNTCMADSDTGQPAGRMEAKHTGMDAEHRQERKLIKYGGFK